MSLQERISSKGKKIHLPSTAHLTPEELEGYERAVVMSIPGLSKCATLSRVENVVNGIIVGFVPDDRLNLSEVVLRLSDRHAGILDEIRILSDNHSVYIRFKALAPYPLGARVCRVVVCWLIVFILAGCKQHLAQMGALQ